MSCFWTNLLGVSQVCPDAPPSFMGEPDLAFNISERSGTGSILYAISEGATILVSGRFSPIATRAVARVDAGTGVVVSYTELNGDCTHMVKLPDGKILLSGSFTLVGGVARSRVARLNSDLTIDADFTSALEVISGAYDWNVAAQSDGKIIVRLPNVGGAAYIARLNSDGSSDDTFTPPIFACNNPNGGIFTTFSVRTHVLPDDSLLMFGGFSHTGGIVRRAMSKLRSDGTMDAGFDAGLTVMLSDITYLNPRVESLHQLGDRLIIGGTFDPDFGETQQVAAIAVNSSNGQAPAVLLRDLGYGENPFGATLDNGQTVLVADSASDPRMFLYDSDLSLIDTFSIGNIISTLNGVSAVSGTRALVYGEITAIYEATNYLDAVVFK